MRQFSALIFGFVPLSLCLTSAVSLANDRSFSFSKSWGSDSTNSHTVSTTHCAGRMSRNEAFGHYLQVAENSAQANLPDNFEITCRVKKDGGSTTTVFEQANGVATEEDLFYCEQAISEAFCVEPYDEIEGVGKLQSRNKIKDREVGAKTQYLKLHPELAGKIVVLRIIPDTMLEICPFLTKTELHSSENLAAIPIANLHSKLLRDFRSEWTEFCRAYNEDDEHVSVNRPVLLSKADELMTKYKALFL